MMARMFGEVVNCPALDQRDGLGAETALAVGNSKRPLSIIWLW